MKAPKFWAQGGLLALVLAPLSWIWRFETSRRLRNGRREKLSVPTICIGNLTAGGTGKTPMAIAVMELLQSRGTVGNFISRGYGGSNRTPLQVDPARHKAAQVGDEPLFLAAFAPTWVGRDRAATAKAAIAAGAQALIFDDGFQNASLHYDLSILTIDAESGFGSGRIIPAGPLREPIVQGLQRADLIVSIGDADAQAKFSANRAEIETLRAALNPLKTGMDWHGLRVLAFAGIGRPAKFFATLKSFGAEIVATREFGDHAPYTPQILKRLAADARALKAQLVTTEKDAARLPTSFLPKVLTLPVRLVLSDESRLAAAIERLFH